MLSTLIKLHMLKSLLDGAHVHSVHKKNSQSLKLLVHICNPYMKSLHDDSDNPPNYLSLNAAHQHSARKKILTSHEGLCPHSLPSYRTYTVHTRRLKIITTSQAACTPPMPCNFTCLPLVTEFQKDYST